MENIIGEHIETAAACVVMVHHLLYCNDCKTKGFIYCNQGTSLLVVVKNMKAIHDANLPLHKTKLP